MSKTRRQHIIDLMSDTLGRMLYYDRKEDEDLGVGEIEKAIVAGEVTVDEMIDVLRSGLFRAAQK